MSSDEGADWGSGEDCWDVMPPGPCLTRLNFEPLTHSCRSTLFPVTEEPAAGTWHPNELPAIYRAFWDPYRRCESIPFTLDEASSHVHNDQEEAEGPLDCRYEHIGRKPLAALGRHARSAPVQPDVASRCPDKTRLTTLLAYLSNHITCEEAFEQAKVVLVLTDSNPHRLPPLASHRANYP